jgi:hypothetical protein
VPDSGLPHDRQTLFRSGCRGWYGREWDWEFPSKLAPHIPQNFPVSKSGEPHEVHTPAEADVGISAAGCTGRSGPSMDNPHNPQYFSSAFMGLLQDLQIFGMAGSEDA